MLEWVVTYGPPVLSGFVGGMLGAYVIGHYQLTKR
jgi:hypothetical protein